MWTNKKAAPLVEIFRTFSSPDCFDVSPPHISYFYKIMTSSVAIDVCNARATACRLIYTLCCNRERSNCCSTTKPQRHVSHPIHRTDQRHREAAENSIDVSNIRPSLSIRFRVRISRMHYGLLWKWASRWCCCNYRMGATVLMPPTFFEPCSAVLSNWLLSSIFCATVSRWI